MKTKNKIISIVTFAIGCCAVSIALYYVLRPSISMSSFSREEFTLGEMNTLLEDGRQCGYINMQNFVKLASKHKSVFNEKNNVKIVKDSVIISSLDPRMFFGINNGEWWRNKYVDLPISFPGNNSFKAALHKEKGVTYIYIPYQILSCLVEYHENENKK